MRVRRAAWCLGLVVGCAGPTASSRSGPPGPAPAPSNAAGGAPTESASGLTVPGTYMTGPRCAGDSEAEVTLSLYPDSQFVLRQTQRDPACGVEVSILYF